MKPKITPVQKVLDTFVNDFINTHTAYRTRKITPEKMKNRFTLIISEATSAMEKLLKEAEKKGYERGKRGNRS